jgi:two-component system OmpR family response regulator
MTAPAVRFVHPSARPLRVLLADDDQDSTDSLAELLMIVGCDVCKCYDGGEALRSADEFRPDVCILDLWMPVLNGWAVAERLRTWADARSILLIALTGVGGRQSMENSLAAGFDYHILNPSDPQELFADLTDFIERMEPVVLAFA